MLTCLIIIYYRMAEVLFMLLWKMVYSIDVVNTLIRCGADIKALDWVRSMYIRYVLININ